MSSSQPISLNYLVFDDDNDAKKQYQSNINIPSCDCNIIFINPVDFFDADSNIFNGEGFISDICEKTKGININLIISDWNILPPNEDGFSGIVGWDIIEYVIKAKDKLKSRSFLIYSADLKKASKYIIDRIKGDIDKDDLITSLDFVTEILELKLKFCKRDDNRFAEIVTLLKSSNTISNIVLNSILNFDKNTVINTGNEHFDGKQISDLINDNPDVNGLKFIREFIELSIANYTELNA
jgi:hypothetical protein